MIDLDVQVVNFPAFLAGVAATGSHQGGDQRAADALLPHSEGRARQPSLVLAARRGAGPQHHPLDKQVRGQLV